MGGNDNDLAPKHKQLPPRTPLLYAIYNYPSQWFLLPQGTGILAIILHQNDYQFDGLYIIAIILWVLTIIMLVMTVLIYLTRAVLYPKAVAEALRTNQDESNCLASISIAYTTIVIMVAITLTEAWGQGWGIVAYVLWWINVGIGILAAFGLPYVLIQYSSPGIKMFKPSAQLPMIAAITVGAGGGALARYAALDAGLSVPLIIISYMFIGIGVPLALATDAVYFARVIMGYRPEGLPVFQSMVLCGPWGQSSFALLALGGAIQRGAFGNYGSGYGHPTTSFISAGAQGPIGYTSEFMGLICWAQGTFWWGFAIMTISYSLINNFKTFKQAGFGLPVWSLIFPWGVYTNAAVQLGKSMPSVAMKVWSTALAIMLVIMWLILMAFTLFEVFTGRIFGLEKGWVVPPLEDGDDQARTKKDDDVNRDKSDVGSEEDKKDGDELV